MLPNKSEKLDIPGPQLPDYWTMFRISELAVHQVIRNNHRYDDGTRVSFIGSPWEWKLVRYKQNNLAELSNGLGILHVPSNWVYSLEELAATTEHLLAQLN